MRSYPQIEEQIIALVRTQPLASTRFIVKALTERGHCSVQAVKNALKALEFDGDILNVGGEAAAWRLPK